MAGMLPGIEHARRRRFYQKGTNWLDSRNTSGFSSSTRSSSFCIYTSSHDQYYLSSTSSKQKSIPMHEYQDEKLVEIAREAKKRLDERLSAQWKSLNKRSINNKKQKQGVVDTRPNLGVADIQNEVFGLKKSVSKKFSWGKLRLWKASEQQDECVICLDQFRLGDNLMQLRCGHKFHSKCLVPWLQSNSHCPCCRMQILTTPYGGENERKKNKTGCIFHFLLFLGGSLAT